MPAISSGIFGFPKVLCAKTLFRAAEEFAASRADDPEKRFYLKKVRFTNFDQETVGIFQNEFKNRYTDKVRIINNRNKEEVKQQSE